MEAMGTTSNYKDDFKQIQKATVAQSLSRIYREFIEINKEKNPFWCAFPLQTNDPYEWHFTIRGPVDSDFAGGLYHGRIVLPQNYPFSPPDFFLLTQNGRFEVGKKVCLSASSYHPELWHPAWGLRTLLDALHAFFPTPGEGALHSLDWPAEVRRKIAQESVHWTCPGCKLSNEQLVAEKCLEPSNSEPVLPAVLKEQTTLFVCKKNTKVNRNVTLGVKPAGHVPNFSNAGIDIFNCSTFTTCPAAVTPSLDIGNRSSTNGLVVECVEDIIHKRRQRPKRRTNQFWSQIFLRSRNKLELIIVVADVLIIVFAISIFLLLLSVAISPPTAISLSLDEAAANSLE